MIVKRYGVPSYTPDEDTLLAQWFLTMQANGDLARTLMPACHTFGGFFDFCRKVVFLGYALDDAGKIAAAAWGESFMSAISLGVWIAPEKRVTRWAVDFVLETYDALFAAGVPVVLGFTKQPGLVQAHETLGYTVVGTVPDLWDGEDTIVVALQEHGYREATAALRRREAA